MLSGEEGLGHLEEVFPPLTADVWVWSIDLKNKAGSEIDVTEWHLDTKAWGQGIGLRNQAWYEIDYAGWRGGSGALRRGFPSIDSQGSSTEHWPEKLGGI